MTYHRTSLGQLPFEQSGGSVRWGMPMPIQAPGPVGPAMATTIYPRTGLRWGDPVSITGPFAGSGQGHVRVKFAGAPATAPQILGPFQASVQVPEGSQTGECWVELDGRRLFGGVCEIVPARTHGAHRRGTEEWRDFGQKGLHGMGYVGVGELIQLGPKVAATPTLTRTGEPLTARLPVARAPRTAAPAQAPVVAEKRFPVLLVAGIGAAAVLGYVVWRRRRA